MPEIKSTASNLSEWLIEIEPFENKKPEDDYYVKVSVRLMCKILRLAKENNP